MGIREKLTGPVGYVLVAVMLIAAITIAMTGGENSQRRMTVGVWFLDIKTDKLYVVDENTPPPTKAPSGGNDGVKAYVYSCGACDDEATHFVGYIEKYTDDAIAAINDASLSFEDRDLKRNAGRVVSKREDVQWVQRKSNEGQALITEAMSRCKGSQIKGCEPTSSDNDLE